MKKLLVFILILAARAEAFAQTDTSMIEQYCTVVATPRILSSRVTIDIDYGEKRSAWKDHRLKDEDGRLRKFNSVIDALNFMGSNDWKLVNAFPVSTGNNTYIYYYVFRKLFLKSESTQTD